MSVPLDIVALPFDWSQRCWTVAEIADAVRSGPRQSPLTGLDVGGYLRTRLRQSVLPSSHSPPQDGVAAVDLDVERVDNHAVASGLALPFSDAACDRVVSCDTLEHVTPACWSDVVQQIPNVARYCAVTIAPFDSENDRCAEQMLHSHVTSWGAFDPQLQEHMRSRFPSLESLRELLSQRELAFFEFSDEYLSNWLAMMLVKHTPGLTLDLQLNLDRWYNRHLTPRDRREPAYRHLFIITKPGNEELLTVLANATAAFPLDAFPDPMFETELEQVLEHAQAEAPSTLAARETENARLRQQVDGYEQGRSTRLIQRVHRWRCRLTGDRNAE